MKYKITLYKYKELPKHGDYDIFGFYFNIIEEKFINKPEEESKTKQYFISVKISEDLKTQWNLSDEKNLKKILFEFGKRYIIEKVKDKTIKKKESIFLNIFDQDKTSPYNPDRIEDPNNFSETIEIPEKSLLDNVNYNQLAVGIIEKRDNINSIFYYKYQDKLFFLKQERDILQLFKEVNSEDEFTSKKSSLAILVTNLNGSKIKEITGSSLQDNKTIDLFEEYLKSITNNYEDIIKIFRNINKIRQSFPIHGDETTGLFAAYKYFNIKYPIENYNEAWNKILKYYSISLEKILNIFAQEKG